MYTDYEAYGTRELIERIHELEAELATLKQSDDNVMGSFDENGDVIN